MGGNKAKLAPKKIEEERSLFENERDFRAGGHKLFARHRRRSEMVPFRHPLRRTLRHFGVGAGRIIAPCTKGVVKKDGPVYLKAPFPSPLDALAVRQRSRSASCQEAEGYPGTFPGDKHTKKQPSNIVLAKASHPVIFRGKNIDELINKIKKIG